MFKEIAQGMLIGLGFAAALAITILMALLAWSFIVDDGMESYSRAQLEPETKIDLTAELAGNTQKFSKPLYVL